MQHLVDYLSTPINVPIDDSMIAIVFRRQIKSSTAVRHINASVWTFKRTLSIKQIKNILIKQFKRPECTPSLLEITFKGRQLQNWKTLNDYKVITGDVFEWRYDEPIEILIIHNTITTCDFRLRVTASTRIGSIRKKIHHIIQPQTTAGQVISRRKLSLYFKNDRRLKMHKTIAGCGIKDGDIIVWSSSLY
eukprot:1542_1